MKKATYEEFISLLQKGELYFKNSFEDAVIRAEHNEEISFFVKFKGEKEFKSEAGSNIVAGGIQEHTVISKADYYAY